MKYLLLLAELDRNITSERKERVPFGRTATMQLPSKPESTCFVISYTEKGVAECRGKEPGKGQFHDHRLSAECEYQG